MSELSSEERTRRNSVVSYAAEAVRIGCLGEFLLNNTNKSVVRRRLPPSRSLSERDTKIMELFDQGLTRLEIHARIKDRAGWTVTPRTVYRVIADQKGRLGANTDEHMPRRLREVGIVPHGQQTELRDVTTRAVKAEDLLVTGLLSHGISMDLTTVLFGCTRERIVGKMYDTTKDYDATTTGTTRIGMIGAALRAGRLAMEPEPLDRRALYETMTQLLLDHRRPLIANPELFPLGGYPS